MLRTLIVCGMQTTNVTTDTSGAVTSRTRYKPFGEVLTTSGQETTGTLNTERKFGGQTFDTGTDMYFYGGRYYDRTLRRFTTAGGYSSAFTLPQGLNRYSNAMNNPYSPRGGGLPSLAYSTEGRTSSKENSGSAAQSYALQAANIYNAQEPNPNVVYDVPRLSQNQSSMWTNMAVPVSFKNKENISAKAATPGPSQPDVYIVAFDVRFRVTLPVDAQKGAYGIKGKSEKFEGTLSFMATGSENVGGVGSSIYFKGLIGVAYQDIVPIELGMLRFNHKTVVSPSNSYNDQSGTNFFGGFSMMGIPDLAEIWLNYTYIGGFEYYSNELERWLTSGNQFYYAKKFRKAQNSGDGS